MSKYSLLQYLKTPKRWTESAPTKNTETFEYAVVVLENLAVQNISKIGLTDLKNAPPKFRTLKNETVFLNFRSVLQRF